MKNSDPLTLPEQVLLIALRDQKGTIEFRANMYAYAVGGAILAELALADRIKIDEGPKRWIEVVNRKPTGDALLDEGLERLASAKRKRRATQAIMGLANIPKLKHKIAQSLCDKGTLKGVDSKVLFFFTRRVYPERDPKIEKQLVEKIGKAIKGTGKLSDPRIAILIGIAHSSGLLSIHFTRKELKAQKKRIEQICEGTLLSDSTGKAVQEAVTAVTAAIIGATVATSVASST